LLPHFYSYIQESLFAFPVRNPVDVFSYDWSAWGALTFKDLPQELRVGVKNVVSLSVPENLEVF